MERGHEAVGGSVVSESELELTLGLGALDVDSESKDSGGEDLGLSTDTPEGETESDTLTLQTLPNEMFLHIVSFLEAGFVIRRMSLVCRQFYEMLSNEQTWKIRQMKRWGANGSYPPVPVDEEEFCWSRACVKREEQIKLWGNNGCNLRNVELRGHIACVDSVHLFEGGKYLASGSRDRSIVIWDVEKCFTDTSTADSSGVPVQVANSVARLDTKPAAHRGWIWAFATNASHLVSASWDTSVRIWDRKSDFQLVTEVPTRVACLSISAMESYIACGTFDKKVLLFDPRENYKPITWYTAHRKSVLALGLDETRVISCGEDGKCVSFDLRAKRVQKSFTLPNGAFPTCLSFRREDPAPLFYIGDNTGGLHLIDSRDFDIVQSYEVGHSRTVQGVFHGLGSVFTCSRDGVMKIFEPSSGLKELASFEIGCELPQVHSLNNIVALADAEGTIRLWSPVEGF